MAAESFNALTSAHIPQLARAVNTASKAVVSCEVELAATELATVAFKGMKALASANIPDFGCVVKR